VFWYPLGKTRLRMKFYRLQTVLNGLDNDQRQECEDLPPRQYPKAPTTLCHICF
jgi:hypothetical protein